MYTFSHKRCKIINNGYKISNLFFLVKIQVLHSKVAKKPLEPQAQRNCLR
jgi:hypothetical protein